MIKKIIIGAVALALVITGFVIYSKRKGSKKINYVSVEAHIGEILEAVETTVQIEPLNRVEVKSAISGRVEKLLAEEGDYVRRGQTLAFLSSYDRMAIIDAARAKSREELAYWEDTYKSTPVISPITGRIILRKVVEGETVAAAGSLFAVSDDLIVKADVDEADIGKIKRGQSAVITADAYPDEKIKGSVFQILQEGKTSNNITIYSVKIRPYGMPSKFKSQMTANILITVLKKPDAVLIPSAAIIEKPSGERAVLTGTAEKPSETAVTTGIDDGVNVEILSGLKAGDKIYIDRQNYSPQSALPSSPFFMKKSDSNDSGNTTASKGVQRRVARLAP
ncbi:MAG: efflux RND transporter periplasmic adaptor subunit [Elusimicrobia bacterium]|nr:efflux RND transporter periplasmic adaptor subunit [Elusimicrobiota bacterium]